MTDQTLAGGAGNNTLDGGPGTDTVEYAGNSTDYTITRNADGTLTVVDNNTGDGLDEGTDTLVSIERIRFLGDGVTVWYPAVRMGDEVRVNEHTEGIQIFPQTVQLADGRMLFVFQTRNSTDGDASDYSIAARIATVNADGSLEFKDEHRVNEHTNDGQEVPRVLQLNDGRILFMFHTEDSTDGDGSSGGIAARVGTANLDGTFAFADELPVNQTTFNNQTDPDMVELADGRVLFVYHSWTGNPNLWVIHARVGTVNVDGTIAFANEFVVSEELADSTFGVQPFQLADGRVMFVYGTNDDDNGDTSFQSVVVRVGTINPDGSATLGSEILVNEHTENGQGDPQVIQLADGRVLFTFFTQDATNGDDSFTSVAARVGTVEVDGSITFGDELLVNEHLDDNQDLVQVIQLTDGRVLFVYQTVDATDGDASWTSVAARLGTVETDGSISFSEEFRINEHVMGRQSLPQVTELADGRVVFTFSTHDPADGDFDSAGIATRILDFGGGGTDQGETLVGIEPGVALMGYGGADELIGSNGDDLLDGGLGRDLLIGGRGADTFILGDTTDIDTIGDFNASDDFIDVSALFGGLTLNQANVADFLRLDMADGLCVLQFDADGPVGNGAGAPFRNAAFIEGLKLGDTVRIIDDSDTVPVVLDLSYDGPLSPTARDDEIIVVDNAPTQIGLLANDEFGADGVDPATGVSFTDPADGTVSFDPVTGLFTYTPSGGFNGPDTFTYTIEDANGDESTATVDLDVRDPADIPSPVIRLDDEDRVNQHIAGTQWSAQVTHLPDGRVVFAFGTFAGALNDTDESSIGGRVGTVNADGSITFGDEFQVNEHPKDWQTDPQIITLADGRVLFTFQTNDPTNGDTTGSFGRPDSIAGRIGTVNGDGSVTFGDEFRVNEHTTDVQFNPQVTQLADGRVLFTFTTKDPTDSPTANTRDDLEHIAARVGTVNNDGSVTFTGEHRVNEHFAGFQGSSQATQLTDGRVLFTFHTSDSTDGDGDGNSVAGRVATVNGDGTFSFGDEFRVNQHTGRDQRWPEITQLDDGRVLFLFRTQDPADGDDSDYGLSARIGAVQPDGSVDFGDEFRVNQHIIDWQDFGQVLQLDDGRVLFLFRTEDPTDGDTDNSSVAARIGAVRNDGSIEFGDEFRINLHTAGRQSDPHVVQLADGRLVISFITTANADGDDNAVAYRVVDLDGQGTARADTLVATHPGGKLVGLAGDDTLIGSSGDDHFLWNVGDGRDVVDGGAETDADIMKIRGDGTAETFDIYSNAEAVAQIGYAGAAEIVVARNGAIVAELTEIEDIVIDGRGGGDTFITHGSFDGTNLATSTITHIGSAADDTVDLSALASQHRVIFHAGGGDDSVTGDRQQDLIDITGRTIDTTEPLGGGRFLVTFDNGATLTYDGNAQFTENDGIAPVAKDFAFGGEIPVGIQISVSAADIISEFGSDADSDLDATSVTFNSASVDGGPAVPLSDIGFSYSPGAGDAGSFTIDNKSAPAFTGLGNGETVQVVITFTVSDGIVSDQGSLTYTVTGTPGTYDVELNYLGENVVGQDVQAESEIGESAAEFEFSGDSTLNDIADDLDISQIDSFDFVADLDGDSLTGAFALSDGGSSAASATQTTALAFAAERGSQASATGNSSAVARADNSSQAKAAANGSSVASADAARDSSATSQAAGDSASSATADDSSNASAMAAGGSTAQANAQDDATATTAAKDGSAATADAFISSTSTASSENTSSASVYSNGASSGIASATDNSIADAVAIENSDSNAEATNGSDAMAAANKDSTASADAQDQSSASAVSDQGSSAEAIATSGSTNTALAADQSEATSNASDGSVSLALALDGASASASATDGSGSCAAAEAATATASANTNGSAANAFAFRSGTATADATDDALSSAIATDNSSADAGAEATSASRAYAGSGEDNGLAPLPSTIGPGVASQAILETTSAVTVSKAQATDFVMRLFQAVESVSAMNLVEGGTPNLSTTIGNSLPEAPVADPVASGGSSATANAVANSKSEATAVDSSMATSAADDGSTATAFAGSDATATSAANDASYATAVALYGSEATAKAEETADSTALAVDGSIAFGQATAISSATADAAGKSDADARANDGSTSAASAGQESSAVATASEESVANADSSENGKATAEADNQSASSSRASDGGLASATTHNNAAADAANLIGPPDIAIAVPASVLAAAGGETQSTTISGLPAGTTLSAGTPNGDGTTWTFVGAPPPGLTLTPPAGYVGEFELTHTATENESNGTAVQTVRIFVGAPPVAQEDDVATNEDSSIIGSVFEDNGNGPDNDPEGDPLTVTRVNGQAADVGSQITLASGALLTLNADGSFVYDPNGSFENLAGGESDNDTFTYRITDGNGGFDSATVTLDIDGINDPPVAVDDALSTDEDTSFSGNVLDANGGAADSDIEGDPLAVTHVNGVDSDIGSQITLASGALLTLAADGSFDYDPNGAFEALEEGQAAVDSFTYTIDDGQGGQATATVSVDIDGRDDGPIVGTPQADDLAGTGGNDDIRALAGDDFIRGSDGSDRIDGGPGSDRVVHDDTRAGYTQKIVGNGTVTLDKPGGGTDTLTNVERIDFTNGDYVYDIVSANLGFIYRIYEATFNRTPDEGGLRFWMGEADLYDQLGWSEYDKQHHIARIFHESVEFGLIFGDDTTNYQYIDAMYRNVLNRPPDQEGHDYWTWRMDQGASRAEILVFFSESVENRIFTDPHIDDGVWVV